MSPSPLCPLLCASPDPHLLPAQWEDTVCPHFASGPSKARRQRLPGAVLPSAGPQSRAAPRAPTAAATKLTGNFFRVRDNVCGQRNISPTQQCLRTEITGVHPTTHLGYRYLPGPQLPCCVQPSPAWDTAPSCRSWARAVPTCPRATHSTRHAPAQPVRPVQHLLLPRASSRATHGSAGDVPRESERSLAPPRSRAAEVSLETLPCMDSLSQCSPSARPLDPAGRAGGADSHAVARLAQKRLRDKGSDAAKSSGTWLRAWISTNIQAGDKVAFSKGATGPANTGEHQHSSSGAGRSLPPPTGLQAGQTPSPA